MRDNGVSSRNCLLFQKVFFCGEIVTNFHNASKQARQVSKRSRRLTNAGCCFAARLGLSELVEMLRWFRRRFETISMLDLTFEEFALKYRLPNEGHDALCISQLGQGGASSGVERLVATPTPDNCKVLHHQYCYPPAGVLPGHLDRCLPSNA